MPELPEVETIRLELKQLLENRPQIEKVKLMRADLRFPIPAKFSSKLKNQPLLDVRRRAKYLLLDTEDWTFLCHLGMTGSWRMGDKEELNSRAHDHAIFYLSSGSYLVYNDPRRFGYFDLFPRNQESSSVWLKHLGPEPLDENSFHSDYLKSRLVGRSASIKSLIMDQRLVVGVGNIYASEALHMSGIHPKRPGGKISMPRLELLVESVRNVLKMAISAGGSTIRDFQGVAGHRGDFQQSFKVYGREGDACVVCASKIRSEFIVGRNTFWCPRCQK